MLLWVAMMALAPLSSAKTANTTANIQRSGDALNAGDTQGAISLLQQELRTNPDNAYAFANLALAYYKNRQYSQALDVVNTALLIQTNTSE